METFDAKNFLGLKASRLWDFETSTPLHNLCYTVAASGTCDVLRWCCLCCFLVLQARDASDISFCIHIQKLILKLVQRAHRKMSFQRLLFLTRYALFLFKDTVPKTLLILKDYTLCIILWHRDKPSTATHGTAYLLSYLATLFGMLKHELKFLGCS